MLTMKTRPSLHTQGAPVDEWISPKDAAGILDVSVSTVLRSLKDPDSADEWWGVGNWRRKPLTARRDMQVRHARALEIADGTDREEWTPPEPPEEQQ